MVKPNLEFVGEFAGLLFGQNQQIRPVFTHSSTLSLNNEGVVSCSFERLNGAQQLDEVAGFELLLAETLGFVSWAHGFDFV